MSDELELRVAWERFVGDSPPAHRQLDALLARHREPQRHYHGVRHVCWVVRHALDLAGRAPVGDLGAVVAAAFFHDAVYEPASGGNEAASARLARDALGKLGWPAERCGRVAAMIEATAAHEADQPGDPDTACLLAADLAVLAAQPGPYGDYVRAVRREYVHVGDADWSAGRAAVLRTFLERPTIFDPALGLDDWEARARVNLTAELATLQRRG